MAENPSIIIDTSFILALVDQKDSLHKKAKAAAEKYSSREWITTWPVLTELNHLLPSRFFLQLLQLQQEELFSIFPLEEEDLTRLIQLGKKYLDHQIDLADLSLIILAEEIGHGEILTCDKKDFSFLRWERNRPFVNLFF